MEATLFVSGLILALSQLNQSLVNVLKSKFLPGEFAPYVSIITGIGLVFLVREANISMISALLANPYFAALNGLAVGLISSGFYAQNQNATLKSMAEGNSKVVTVGKDFGDSSVKP